MPAASVVNRLRLDADPDPTFHFDADPDPDPNPRFTHVRTIFFTFIHSCASLHCFIFLVSVIFVIIFNILNSFLEVSKV